MPSPLSRNPTAVLRGPFTPLPKPLPPKPPEPQSEMDRLVDGFWKAMAPTLNAQDNMLKWFQHRELVTRPGYVPPGPPAPLPPPGIASAVAPGPKTKNYLAAAHALAPSHRGAQELDKVTDSHLATLLKAPKLDLNIAGTTAVALELGTTRLGENAWASEGERLVFAQVTAAYPGLTRLDPPVAWNLILGVGVAQETDLGKAGAASLGKLLAALGHGAHTPEVKQLAARLLKETKVAYGTQYDNGKHHRRAGLVRLSQALSVLIGTAGKTPGHGRSHRLVNEILCYEPLRRGQFNQNSDLVHWPGVSGLAPASAVHTVINDAVGLTEGALAALGLKMPPVTVVDGLNNAEAIDGGIRIGTTLASTLTASQLAQVLGHEAFHLFSEDPETSALSNALKDAGIISADTAVAIEHATELTADVGAAVVGYMIGDTEGYLGFLADNASPATASHPATADRMAVYKSTIEGLEQTERYVTSAADFSDFDAPIDAGDPNAASDFGGLNDFGVDWHTVDDSGREVGAGDDGDADSAEGGIDGGFDAGGLGDGSDGGEG